MGVVGAPRDPVAVAAAPQDHRDRRDPHDRRARQDPCPGPMDRPTVDHRDRYPAGTALRGTPPTADRRGHWARPARRDRTSRDGGGDRAYRDRRTWRRQRKRPPARTQCLPRSPPTPRRDRAGSVGSQPDTAARVAARATGSGVRVLGSCVDHAQAESDRQPITHVSRIFSTRATRRISG